MAYTQRRPRSAASPNDPEPTPAPAKVLASDPDPEPAKPAAGKEVKPGAKRAGKVEG